jgi:hypothetical protein
MESEIEPLGMRINCLPTEKSLGLTMHHVWPIVAEIAGSLMAGGHFTTPRFAVKAAREIVEEARKPEMPSEETRNSEPSYTINGNPCETAVLLSAFEPKDLDRIRALEVGSEFRDSAVVVRRIR